MRIGIFDSGIGGFSILQELKVKIPEADFFYFADDLYTPYGNKTEDQIIERSINITRELMEQSVDIVLVACNTATAVSINKLRETFKIPFVGVEPYINYLNKENLISDDKLLVVTTILTGRSQRFLELKKKLDTNNVVDHLTLPNLAGHIENLFYKGRSKDIVLQIEDDLNLIKKGEYSHLILGCTHYCLIQDFIKKFLNIKTISPSLFVADQVVRLSNQIDSINAHGPNKSFYFKSSKKNEWAPKSFNDISIAEGLLL